MHWLRMECLNWRSQFSLDKKKQKQKKNKKNKKKLKAKKKPENNKKRKKNMARSSIQALAKGMTL